LSQFHKLIAKWKPKYLKVLYQLDVFFFTGGFSQGGAVALHTLQTCKHKLGGCIGLSTFLTLHKNFDKVSLVSFCSCLS